MSSDSSVESNLSIPSQEELLRKHCAEEGILVHYVYKDEGVSGSTDQRKAFQKMIAAACNPEGSPFQYIFVHSTSRFARNTSDFLAYERQLALNGVEVRSITQKFSKDTGGFISKRVTTMFDEFHSIRTSVDVRRARLHMAREGIWPGCQPPFGFKLEAIGEVRGKTRNRLVIDEGQRAIVELIFGLTQYGDGQSSPLGIKAIVSWLNARGYTTRQGGRWSVNAIHSLLTNSVYKGEYRFNQRTKVDEFSTADLQQVVIIPVDPIIEPERFEEVQQLLERRSPKREGKLISSPLLLAGIAYCKCGSAMTLRTGTGNGGVYRYYGCGRASRYGTFDCTGPKVAEAVLDAAVIGAVRARVMQPERLIGLLGSIEQRRVEKENQANQTVPELQRELQAAETKLRGLIRTASEIPELEHEPVYSKDLAAAMRLVKARRAAIEAASAEIGNSPRITPDKIDVFRARMEELLSGNQKAQLKVYLSKIVRRVEVGEEDIEIIGHDSDLEAVIDQPPSCDAESSDQAVPVVHRTTREWCGRPESNRHRPFGPTDFLTRYGFRRPARGGFGVWTIPSP